MTRVRLCGWYSPKSDPPGGRRLAELMIEHGIGVAEEHVYSVKKIHSDYFDEA